MGRPQFSQSGTDGGGQTVAVTNRPEVKHIKVDGSGSVASGGMESLEIYAPSGSIYKIKSLSLYARNDADATTGDHEFKVRPLDQVDTITGKSNYNTYLTFQRGAWKTADLEQFPSNEAAQQSCVNSLRATENSALTVRYYNNTDVTYDRIENAQVVVEEDQY